MRRVAIKDLLEMCCTMLFGNPAIFAIDSEVTKAYR